MPGCSAFSWARIIGRTCCPIFCRQLQPREGTLVKETECGSVIRATQVFLSKSTQAGAERRVSIAGLLRPGRTASTAQVAHSFTMKVSLESQKKIEDRRQMLKRGVVEKGASEPN